MKFYFVRHGKTQWNVEGRFQGANGDSPIIENSLKEITSLGKYLAPISFDAVITSDLKRAIDTATIINNYNHSPKKLITTPKLREWKLGKLEGQKIATATAIYPKQMEAFFHNLARFNHDIFEAESVYKTTHRVTEVIQTLKGKPYQNVLIVGHGANLTASIRNLLGYSYGELRSQGGLENVSLTILETSDFKTFDCLTWNDKSYLLKEENIIEQVR